MDSTIIIDNITIGYHRKGNNKVVHSDISGKLEKGELTCLLGPNGAGKSTLLRTLSGFQTPLDGEIYIDGKAISKIEFQDLSKLISVVLTEKCNIQNVTVKEMVSYGRSPYTGFFGKLSRKDIEIVDDAIEKVGISNMKDRLLQNLSDGERQKVMIAKALVQETPVIFLDEPAAFLDLPSKVELMQLLHSLAVETGKIIFLSTHDLDLALQSADKLWLLAEGKELKIGTPEDLIIEGELKNFFAREGITFDKRTGLFKIKNKHYSKIEVEGHGFEYTLLRRALSRNGIEPVHGVKTDHKITIVGGDDFHFIIDTKDGDRKIFYSISDLISKLKLL